MKGLLKDAALIGVTALAVTVYQGHAQDDPNGNENLRYDLTCPTGQIVGKIRSNYPPDAVIELGHTGLYAQTGQVTQLTGCDIIYYEVDTPSQ